MVHTMIKFEFIEKSFCKKCICCHSEQSTKENINTQSDGL